MLVALLDQVKIEAVTAASAELALALVENQRFELYLLDVKLPCQGGFALCRQIRVLEPLRPIVIYSGAAYEADRERGIEAGANACLSKPDIEGLLGKITSLVFSPKIARRIMVSSRFDKKANLLTA